MTSELDILRAEVRRIAEENASIRQDNTAIQQGVERATARCRRAERKLRVLAGLALCAVVGGLLAAGRPIALADDDKNGVKHRVEVLEKKVAALETKDTTRSAHIGALQDEVERLRGKVHTLRTDVSDLTATVQNQVSQISTLRGQVSALQTSDSTQTGQIAALGSRADALENKTRYLSVADGDMYVRGTNLHVENGEPDPGYDLFGQPNPPTLNGKGNLILGYNTLRYVVVDGPGHTPRPQLVPLSRTGSHNLIIGDGNDYTSHSGIVAGYQNTITGVYATITGGKGNTAGGKQSSITGGYFNVADGDLSCISGGVNNRTSETGSSVSGGLGNIAGGYAASVSGGPERSALGAYEWVAGSLFQNE